MAQREIEECLAQAKQAEEAATKAESPVAKSCWRTIAQTYRMLAADKEKHLLTKSLS